MKFIGGQNIIFLGNSGIGENFGQIAPQIKSFDVYYQDAVVVGFHVTRAEYEQAPIVGFYAFKEPDDA